MYVGDRALDCVTKGAVLMQYQVEFFFQGSLCLSEIDIYMYLGVGNFNCLQGETNYNFLQIIQFRSQDFHSTGGFVQVKGVPYSGTQPEVTEIKRIWCSVLQHRFC